jgi:Domain of unknown function (DUF5060)/Cadherin-like domain/Putative collagen-binding domain of a collagenase
MKPFLPICAALILFLPIAAGDDVTLSGELRQWHKLTLSCEGPATSETATPNPFADYRLNAVFSHPATGRTYTVPGYYAADGNAAETGATAGNVWHAHFAPDLPGTWNYRLNFRTGSGVATSDLPFAGISAGTVDGASGSFEVLPTDKTGRDFRGKGRLQYVGRHHLRFAGSGDYFMKCGTDSPENLLAYEDFDATPDAGGRRKSWQPHQQDYDPQEAAPYTWQGGKGSELLGAFHYLAAEGLNAVSFLTFSLDGDDDNVFPHLMVAGQSFGVSGNDTRWTGNKVHHDRFDVSKLAQWEKLFSYADLKGLYLNLKTQEVENNLLMNDPADGIGTERKLYFRELVARFSHHLALNWNLGEESSNSDAQRIAFTEWFHKHDPYRHPVVVHTRDNSNQDDYLPLLGNASKLTGTSLQPADNTAFTTVFSDTARWVVNSANAGKPWVVACDEPGDSSVGLRDNSHAEAAANHVNARKNALWGNPMAGGAGVEWYFGGSSNDGSDITCEDFRTRSAFWPACRHMLRFWETFSVGYWEMSNNNAISSHTSDYCLFKPGDQYVVYLKTGGTTNLNLSGVSGNLTVRWFDPRNGGDLQQGSLDTVAGGGSVSLGTAPSAPTQDWVILVDKQSANAPPAFPGASLATPHQTPVTLSIPKLLFASSDPEGHAVTVSEAGPASAHGGSVDLGTGSIVYTPPEDFSGTDVFFITLSDALGAETSAMATVVVGQPEGAGNPDANPPRIEVSGNTVIVRFQAIPGFPYVIQRSVNLADWENIFSGTAGQTGLLEHIDTAPPASNAFYRIIEP